MSSVDIVIPAKNESKTIGKVITELKEELAKSVSAEHSIRIIVVDNGSDDDTVDQAKAYKADEVIVCNTPGKGSALKKAIELSSSDYVMFHDADGEYSQKDAVSALCEFLSFHKESYDGFVCERLISISDISIKSFIANALVRFILRRIDKDCPNDILSGTRLYKREHLNIFKLESNGFSIETELTKKSCLHGLKILNAKIRYYPRCVRNGKKIRSWDIIPIIMMAIR